MAKKYTLVKFYFTFLFILIVLGVMILSNDQNVEDLVVTALLDRGWTGPQLIDKVWRRREVSRQAVYDALRKLIADEVVHKRGRMYELNRLWLQRLQSLSQRALTGTDHVNVSFLHNLQPGDRVSLKFGNAKLMAAYWAHSFNYIFSNSSSKEPVLVYHPHEWLVLARPEQERYFLQQFEIQNKMMYFSIGGTTALDKHVQKQWRSTYRQINTGTDYRFRNNEYINVIGDTVFTIKTSLGFAQELDTLYRTHQDANPDFEKKLLKLVHKKFKTRLVIECNPKKAQTLRKRFAKDFV